ncbi:calmodulin-binding transcription activator 6-like isoform X2 [Punica granatum]|uniref:Calmodulin-binding transcription activator 6-like isoform X2 n=2 Tax=Punica granatum TaxID=22663 RepID=A0A6P8DW08_PUNGR|nr:calmodulin-binding transcription activator 6-like isoform X2 [Punica granatum]
MEGTVQGQLFGTEIHGFHTLQDLDIRSIMEEAPTRWLRPNEIHAILCGAIILFDRKMLRNFRKDGYNWKKKKDGKTVKEAHEHLKVGTEERIHVYYAHGLDNPTFVRRCYWLLDKAYEHIVLVHYRDTREQSQNSPATPVNSNSSSISDPPASWPLSEEFDSGANQTLYHLEKHVTVPDDSLTYKSHEMQLHEINTLEWDELVTDDSNNFGAPRGGSISHSDQQYIAEHKVSLLVESSRLGDLSDSVTKMGFQVESKRDSELGTNNPMEVLVNDGLQSQDSFGRWMNRIITDSPGSVDDALIESSLSFSCYSSGSSQVDIQQSPGPGQIFSITDVSPSSVLSNEKTKILVTGFFQEGYLHLSKSNLFCITGDVCVPAEIIQVGVYRCLLTPQPAGLVNLYLSFDGHKPISQVLNFEYRDPPPHASAVESSNEEKIEQEFLVQMRLAKLLLSTPKCLDIASSKISPSTLKEGRKFASKTSNLMKSWEYLIKLVEDEKASFARAKESLFELMLKSRLREWLLERLVGGFKSSELDSRGQGVIHLCAILGYTWSVQLFSWSSLSLDFRDKFGWTALHWAAYYGREKMVASLLSAGAKPNLVTDPTPENPGGSTAADLASRNGHEGLAAYLAEKGLVQHFKDMSLAGNISGSLSDSYDASALSALANENNNLTEDELYLKDTLAAYRTAADAAGRIQSAFREHSLKIRSKHVQFLNPEEEARSIIAAMKIQHAFRNYEVKKQMVAASRIQHRFRTWKLRREFLNMRRHAIKIQAAFRAFQARRQYVKIVWSVGVLEKAILRWRLKRKGFRGLPSDPLVPDQTTQQSDTEEDFFQVSRRQAEERVEQSVVRVQAMFRSKKAQEEYRRMKLAHVEAELEYEEMWDHDASMER